MRWKKPVRRCPPDEPTNSSDIPATQPALKRNIPEYSTQKSFSFIHSLPAKDRLKIVSLIKEVVHTKRVNDELSSSIETIIQQRNELEACLLNSRENIAPKFEESCFAPSKEVVLNSLLLISRNHSIERSEYLRKEKAKAVLDETGAESPNMRKVVDNFLDTVENNLPSKLDGPSFGNSTHETIPKTNENFNSKDSDSPISNKTSASPKRVSFDSHKFSKLIEQYSSENDIVLNEPEPILPRLDHQCEDNFSNIDIWSANLDSPSNQEPINFDESSSGSAGKVKILPLDKTIDIESPPKKPVLLNAAIQTEIQYIPELKISPIAMKSKKTSYSNDYRSPSVSEPMKSKKTSYSNDFRSPSVSGRSFYKNIPCKNKSLQYTSNATSNDSCYLFNNDTSMCISLIEVLKEGTLDNNSEILDVEEVIRALNS